MENSSHQVPQKQRPLTLDEAVEYEMKHGRLSNDPNIDLKKIRRNISNKLSAQRSRSKMVNRTRDLEKMVKDLEAQTSILTAQVESYKEKNKLLQLENDSLGQELEKRSNESRGREMEIEEKRAGIKMLKELERTPVVVIETAPDSTLKQSGEEVKPAEETDQEHEDVDQYINFDALDASSDDENGVAMG